jgi:hypothetical protein
MATSSYVESLMGGLTREMRATFKRVFDYTLSNLRFGPPVHQNRAENIQAYWLTATTPTTANEEFSIAHGLARTPYLAIPVLPVTAVGAATVNLQVTRAADASRVYLRSPSTNVPVWILCE